MRRRLLLCALACCPAATLRAQPAPQPHIKVSAAQLDRALAARFPLALGIPGLAALELDSPQLLLRPERNRAGVSLRAQAGGSAIAPVPPGTVDLLFALRYIAADRSVRAVQPELARLDWPGLAPQARQDMEALLGQLATGLDAQLVLHRFSAQELALPDAMGLAPDSLQVVADGVLLGFGPKPGP